MTPRSETGGAAAGIVAWFAFLSVLAFISASYAMFTGFSFWDDEGTMLITVKQYLDGFRLYDEVFSTYGPVYYFFNWITHTYSPVDHNVVRLTSAVLWAIGAFICACTTYQFTKSLVLGTLAHLLTYRALGFFHYEPGHPHELSMLLLCLLVACGLLVDTRRRGMAMGLLGAIAAASLLVKTNIGGFVIFAVSLAIVWQLPQTGLVRLARVVVTAGALVLPLVLMKNHLDHPAARLYSLVVTTSLLALLPGLSWVLKNGSLSVRDVWIALGVAAAVVVAACGILLLQGTSSQAIAGALVLTPLRLNVGQSDWYAPIQLRGIWGSWALAGLISSLLIGGLMRRNRMVAGSLLSDLKGVLGAVALYIAAFRPGSLLGFVPPFCWLLLWRENTTGFARVLLGAVAVLQTLVAYPIAGSQASFLTVCLILAALVWTSDFVDRRLRPVFSATWLPRVTVAAVMAGAAVVYPFEAYRGARLYAAMTPLELRGAERIRVSAQDARVYKWLVHNLQAQCDVFLGLPGFPSLYFWTGKDPPTTLNLGNWMFGLDAEQQSLVASALAAHPEACIVHSPMHAQFWNPGHRDLKTLPLVRYIFENFQTAGRLGLYEFRVRRGRQVVLDAP